MVDRSQMGRRSHVRDGFLGWRPLTASVSAIAAALPVTDQAVRAGTPQPDVRQSAAPREPTCPVTVRSMWRLTDRLRWRCAGRGLAGEVLVKGLAADPELLGELGLGGSFRDAPVEFGDLVVAKRMAPASVDAACFGGFDPYPLASSGVVEFEVGERIERSEVLDRGGSPVPEGECFGEELDVCAGSRTGSAFRTQSFTNSTAAGLVRRVRGGSSASVTPSTIIRVGPIRR